MKTKRCPHCGLVKPLSDFQRCRWMADGRQTWCRDCKNEKNRSYRHPQGKEHASPTARALLELAENVADVNREIRKLKAQ